MKKLSDKPSSKKEKKFSQEKAPHRGKVHSIPAIIKLSFVLLIIVSALAVFFAFKTSTSSPPPPVDKTEPYQEMSPIPYQYDQGTVTVGGIPVKVQIADTLEKQVQGLSWRKSLGEKEGMLFIYADYDIRNFWMHGMNFPLDIIWIKDDQIVGIDQNVPIPPKNAFNDEIPRIYSPQAVNHVLEVNAGFCHKHGIQTGDRINIELYK